ncbi:hypothetical protein ACGFYQ_33935 [Streptomyces sp. NPDC048258]|uniref:hypothetical protein n=1 Tax=Streptomyces sp. NPDC048258 TaxID=3365527 RepID=UPI0037176A8C
MPRRPGTYSNRKITAPDYASIRKAEEDAVKDTLGALSRPDDRVERAAAIIRQADAEIAAHVGDRNAAVASLWFYERVLGLPKVLGVYPTAYREILAKALYGDAKRPLPPETLSTAEVAQLAEEAGVPHIEDAAEKLPELARIVAAAQARRKTAVPFMQEAAFALSEEPYGWDADRIASYAGVSRRLIWEQWDAVKKRRRKAAGG